MASGGFYQGSSPLGSGPEEEGITTILSPCLAPTDSTLQIQTKALGAVGLKPPAGC